MVILTGYVAMSLGVLKIFWRQFGVHFYAHDVLHSPQADLPIDIGLILLLIIAGLCLVLFSAVVPALLTIICVFFLEFTLLHHGPHSLWQYLFVVSAIVGQIITLTVYLIGHWDSGKGYGQTPLPYPSRGRSL